MFEKPLRYLVGLMTLAGLFATLIGVPPGMAQQNSILNQVIQRGTVRIAIMGGNPPYSSMTASGAPEGYDIDIANQLAAALGVKPEFIITDIPGRIVSLQSGKADLTIADFTKTVARSKVIAFSDPYLVVALQFMTLAGRDDLKTVADLDKPSVKIGLTRGGTAEVNVPLAAPNATLSRFDNENDQLLALKSNQVDAISQDNLYNADQMTKNPNTYKVLPGTYSHEEIAIGMPAGDFDWWRIVNAWVDQFNASGDNARLFKKWFGYELPRIQATY